jgi:transcriptional regulator with XRE-family HTH domain
MATTLTHDDMARRLKAVREHLNLKPTEMAELMGSNRTTYANWESGSRAKKPNYPGKEAIIVLCDAVPGLTTDYFYRGVMSGMPPLLGISLVAGEMRMGAEAPSEAQAAGEWATRLLAQTRGG